jgi:septal ring factor EnvC (AmiA/AmiB activator)
MTPVDNDTLIGDLRQMIEDSRAAIRQSHTDIEQAQHTISKATALVEALEEQQPENLRRIL